MVRAIVDRITTEESAAFAIRDLSASSARLVGSLRLFEGERIKLRLEFDEPLELAADVVHVDLQRSVVEVAFRDVAPDARAKIQQSITDLVARVRAAAPPTVLVVHPSVEVSGALERDLARIGVAARVSTNRAELVAQLADNAVHYVGAIVAGMLGEAAGEILQHLEVHNPELSRVLLFGDQIEPLEHPASGRVHAVLRTPWRFK